MRIIPLFGVVSLPEMQAAAVEVLQSGRIASGEYVAQFERSLGEIVGQTHVVSTVDMTSALFLALHLAGVRAGDEVLTTAFACMSTNAVIAQCGAVPVWVDLKPCSVEMDETDLVNKISAKTKAVILYHVAGYPGPAKEIAEICKQHGIPLIEDCNNALFASRDGLPVGSYGDFSVYSFYPNRQINTTEGGALVCKNAGMAATARKLRRFGIDSSTFRNSIGEINPASDIPEVGWAFTMNNLCAAIGCAQLSTAAQRAVKTQKNVEKLIFAISECAGVQVLQVPHESKPAYWVLLLLVEHRDAVLANMKKIGVHTSNIHQRNDAYSGFHVGASVQLLNTTYLQEHVLGIPCGWWLVDKDIVAIVDALRQSICINGLNSGH